MDENIKVCPRCTVKNRIDGRKGPLCGRCGISLDATLYDILGVAKDAATSEIKRAYKGMVLSWHPDRNQTNPLAPLIFSSILHAYRVLGNPGTRSAYDLQLNQVCVSGAGVSSTASTSTPKPKRSAEPAQPSASSPSVKEPFPLSIVLYAVTAILTMSAVSLF